MSGKRRHVEGGIPARAIAALAAFMTSMVLASGVALSAEPRIDDAAQSSPIAPVRSAVVNFTELARLERLGLAPRPGIHASNPSGVGEGAIDREPGAGFVGSIPPESARPPFAPFAVSPSPTSSFIGLDDVPSVDSSAVVIPPDVGGAVGPTRTFEGHNNNYRISNKSNGAVIATVGVATFWAPVAAGHLNELIHPRTLYDPYNNRWIAVMQTTTSGAGLILVAVSQTSDPGGSWFEYAFSTGFSIDFPNVGFNKNWISVAINRYSSGGLFQRGIDLLVNYPSARAGTGTGTIVTLAAGTGFCASPCVTYSAATETLYVVTHLGSAGGTYTLDWISGTASAPTYTVGGATLTRSGGGWAQPSGNVLPQSAPSSGASACGSTPCPIEVQDANVRSAPTYRGGFIYYAQTIGLPSSSYTHTAVQWTRITTAGSPPSGLYSDGGRIEDAGATSTNGGKWYAFPHLAVNGAGDMMVGYTQFSSAQHPSAGYSIHFGGDAAGSIRDAVIAHVGEDYYHKTFTTTTGRNRWGDFSSAQVDPSDDMTLWTLQEYAGTRNGTDDGNTTSNSSRWSNWWAGLAPPAVTIDAGPSVNEGNSGTTPITFTARLSYVYGLPITVYFQTSDGTATVADNDYQALSSSITIPAGSTTGTITVNVVGDTKCESNETFNVTVTSASGPGGVIAYPIGSPSVSTATILNDEIKTITASGGAGGSISPNGATPVSCGAAQAYTITPDGCHVVADVVVDGSSVGAVSSYSFTNVTTNHTITASFNLKILTITATAGAGGSISPAGAVSVNCGANQTFTIVAADPCRTIATVKVDGVSLGAIAGYTFNNVTSDHTIEATFALRGPFTITTTPGAGVSITPAGPVSVACGDSATFSISPADKCHSILDVKVDGFSVGVVSHYTFSDVQTEHTISATSSTLGPFTITATAGANGAISPSGAVSVSCGAGQTFSFSPADKCHGVQDVKVDGASVGAPASYSFADVQANHTIDATFMLLGPFAVTSSAGPGGSISPEGATSVACGGSQSYSITPADKCHYIADVRVDGVSVGAVSSYTVNDVQANRTVDASFGVFGPFSIAATAGTGGAISPAGAVPVACGASQTFSIAPANNCYVLRDVKVDGVSQGAISSYTFTDVQVNHTIDASFTLLTYILRATAGAHGQISPGGLVITDCDTDQEFVITPAACYHILNVKVDGVSVGAVANYTFVDVEANHTIDASFALNALSTSPVTNLASAPVQFGNDGDGTTKIKINFTTPGGAASVEVWRKGFGGYPTYDDGGGSAPSVPATYPPPGWSLTPVTASGQMDEPSTRDFWYYVAYAKDACGNVAPVSSMTSGTLDYHLGDVSNGFTPGQGNNIVNTLDVSLFGAHYGVSGSALASYRYLDVGPTTDSSVNGRPTTDGKTDFEDLLMFALNYWPNASLIESKASLLAAASDRVALEAPTRIEVGETFDVNVRFAGAGDLQALSVGLKWNAAAVKPLGSSAGELLVSQRGVMFPPEPGTLDCAMLGIGPQGLMDEGVLATVRFEVIGAGDPGIAIDRVIGRDAANRNVTVEIGSPLTPSTHAGETMLAAAIPNPTHGDVVFTYRLAKRGPVDLSIYSVDGRRLKTLARGIEDADQHQSRWDGTDGRGNRVLPGVYYARLEFGGVRQSRVFTVLK